MNNEWYWLKDRQPPPDTNVLFLIHNRHVFEWEPEDVQIVWENSNFMEAAVREYPPGYTFVAWMLAPEMPSLETIRQHLSSQETPHE